MRKKFLWRKVVGIFLICKITSLCDDGNSMGTHSTTELDGIDFPFYYQQGNE